MKRQRNTLSYLSKSGLGVALWVLFSTHSAYAGTSQGEQIFKAKKCGGCHQMTGPTEPVEIAERSKIKGPPLWFAGSKFEAEWLEKWLANPKPIRLVKYNTLKIGENSHQSLSATEASEVASFLMTKVDVELKVGDFKTGKLARRKMMNAAKLFTKKQVCFGCHKYPSKQGDIGGFSGPSLVGAGERLQGAWIYAYLLDNVRYYPNGRMPVYGDLVFDPFTDKEFRLLAKFVDNQ